MARAKRIKVRFNLSRGANYMKWKVQYPNGDVSYYDPCTTQLVMMNCQLRNHKGVAKKIFEGGEKVVCAWVLCNCIDIITNDYMPYDINTRRIRYNPRTQPNWLLDDEIVDNEYFDTIASVDYGLYVE